MNHYLGKDDLDKPKSQASIYQKGFGMIFCNPYPIAAACMVDARVVRDGLQAFWRAVLDLVTMGKDIDLNFGFVRIQIIDSNLRVYWKKGFAGNI